MEQEQETVLQRYCPTTGMGKLVPQCNREEYLFVAVSQDLHLETGQMKFLFLKRYRHLLSFSVSVMAVQRCLFIKTELSYMYLWESDQSVIRSTCLTFSYEVQKFICWIISHQLVHLTEVYFLHSSCWLLLLLLSIGVVMHCVKDEHSAINMNLHYLENGCVMVNFIFQKELFFLPLGFALKVNK